MALAFLMAAPAARADTSFIYVKDGGNDSLTCESVTTACATLAGAMVRVAAGGEIVVIPPGNFGPVVINKSVSIIAEPAPASIKGFLSGTSIRIDAGAAGVVHLKGLDIDGGVGAAVGILVASAQRVYISDCAIRNFDGGTTTSGILVDNNVSGVQVFVDNCTLTDNSFGVSASPEGGRSAVVLLDRVRAEGNASAGVYAEGANTFVFLNDTTIVRNGKGLLSDSGAKFRSFGNNAIGANISSGVTPTVIPLQ